MSSNLERSTPRLSDQTASAYIEHLAQNVAQNSDARFAITVRIIDSEEVYALTLPAGYQYITRGLLLRIENECELASVLARGIAHTALRSMMNQRVYVGHDGYTADLVHGGYTPDLVLQKDERFERREELNADYFGIQYLYKSGYDPRCFLTVIPRVWTNNPAKEFRLFPPIPERLEALQNEISDILPKQDAPITTTPEFTGFHEHLLKLNPPKTER